MVAVVTHLEPVGEYQVHLLRLRAYSRALTLPPEVSHAVMRCLEVDRAQRWSTAAQLLEALRVAGPSLSLGTTPGLPLDSTGAIPDAVRGYVGKGVSTLLGVTGGILLLAAFDPAGAVRLLGTWVLLAGTVVTAQTLFSLWAFRKRKRRAGS